MEQVEEECIPKDMQIAEMSADLSSSNDLLFDEEKWQAQYGQVVQYTNECGPNISVIDLWDWKLVVETVKKKQISRLSGRTVKRSSKLHPSVSSGGGILKTAAICDIHLDLVRVASGKVYKLRTPNNKYLASLSAFDSSNPTKDWGFPDLFLNLRNVETSYFDETCGIDHRITLTGEKEVAPVFKKDHNTPYRDRAAERRSLHGHHSIGPGQKNPFGESILHEEEESCASDPQEATAEAMVMTFGKGSYARKILEKMGWKDGEALGSSNKGILEPLEAVANKGNAGLGWNNSR